MSAETFINAWGVPEEVAPNDFIERTRLQLRKDHAEKLKNRPMGVPDSYGRSEEIGLVITYTTCKLCGGAVSSLMMAFHENTQRHITAMLRPR